MTLVQKELEGAYIGNTPISRITMRVSGVEKQIRPVGGGGYKTYAELTAMTLSDAITELNTNASGYYNYLNGDGHIVEIGIANSDGSSYQCWGVTPIIYWNGSWRNGEIIIAKIKTDSSGNLMIPKAGYSLSAAQNAAYNWWVSYDGGSETQYSGTGSAGGITIASGLTANTEHTIVIRPNSESYGWARAFGFYNSGVHGLLTEVIYDGSYEGYSSSSTATGSYFRYFQYRGCTSLLTAPQEVLPSSVTSAGNNFRASQYRDCTSLLKAAQEVFSSSATSIGNTFRGSQYYGCTSLTEASKEVLSNLITSIGSSFRGSQYRGCALITTAPEEVLPNSVTSMSDSFRASQYRDCTGITEIKGIKDLSIGNSTYRNYQFTNCNSMKTVKVLSDVGYAGQSSTLSDTYISSVYVPSAYLQNFIDATIQPRSSITDSKFVGY